jgi:ubiquinone/menaquinone biosynthesis C-methylase UbiE
MIDTDRPSPIGSPEEAFEIAIAQLRDCGAKDVLDCPAGRGALTWRLIEAGLNVTCADIRPESLEISDQTCDFADLNESLPYGEDSFDAIVCLNGLHRVWARGKALAEFSRILRPGGHIVITFCNPGNLSHRLAYFLSGTAMHDMVGPPITQDPYSENPASTYRFPLTVAHIASLADKVSLEITSIGSCNLSMKSLALAPLALGPLLFRAIAPKTFRNKCYLKETTSFHTLFSDFVVVALRKKVS